VRQVALWIGIDVEPAAGSARRVSELLLEHGVLCKDTHEQTVRIARPLITTSADLDWALERIESVLAMLDQSGDSPTG
jgi:ornithine--oxo-acid transaminase